MKQVLTIFMGLLIAVVATISSFASEIRDEPAGPLGTSFSTVMVEDNSPSFTITIPDSVALTGTRTRVGITAGDLSGLDGRAVTVQFGGTQHDENRLILEDGSPDGATVNYVLMNEAGEVVVNSKTAANGGDLIGTELVSFRDSGTAFYQVEILREDDDPQPVPGAQYFGTLTCRIALTD